jgi:hypothetical protein
MQAVRTIGLDIANSVFQVHGVDAHGMVVVRRQLRRRYVPAFFKKLPLAWWASRPAPTHIIGRAGRTQRHRGAARCCTVPEVARDCITALGAQLRLLKAEGADPRI